MLQQSTNCCFSVWASQVQSEICFILDFSRLLALAGAWSGQQGLDRVASGRRQLASPRIKSLLYEILPAANNSGCEHCISQSVWAGKWRREEGASQGSELLWAQARHWDTPLIDLTSRHNVYWRRITRADCMETFHEIRLLNIIPGTFIKNNLWLWNISTRAVLQTTNKHSWCAIFCVSPLRFPPFSTLVSLHKTPILVFLLLILWRILFLLNWVLLYISRFRLNKCSLSDVLAQSFYSHLQTAARPMYFVTLKNRVM